MERIPRKEERRLLCVYLAEKGNNVFPFLYDALNWRHTSWQELSAEQVWQEAIVFSDKILRVNVPKFEVPHLIEELKERTEGERNADFLITLSAVYRLTPLTVTDEQVKKATAFLLSYILDNPLYEIMKQKVAHSEGDKDLLHYKLNIMEYHLSQLEQEKDKNDEMAQKMMDGIIETLLTLDSNGMKEAELAVSRLNDKYGHLFDSQLERLRNARDTKTSLEAQPRIIGQMIGTQQNLSDISGFDALLPQMEKLKELISK